MVVGAKNSILVCRGKNKKGEMCIETVMKCHKLISFWDMHDISSLFSRKAQFVLQTVQKGLSILHLAAYYGSLNITTYYKDVLGFSDINPKDNNGHTPLSWASYLGRLEIVKYYIKNGYKASGEQDF